MKEKIKTILMILTILILGIYFISVLKSYLNTKNRIEAFTNKAECYRQNNALNDERWQNICSDIIWQVTEKYPGM